MTTEDIFQQIQKKKSFLCVGLDTDISKIPPFLLNEEYPIFAFNKAIIKATHNLTVAYKINTAFYESLGTVGWKSLTKTINYINKNHPDIFTIADAKRGDIGNTSDMYAKAFFETLNFNAVTVSPYMGADSVEPFLKYKDKFTIVLALTSNKGASDFQILKNDDHYFFETVIKTSTHWENSQNLMYVVGATKAKKIATIRQLIPNSFLLIPGVGSQGGSLEEVCKYGLNNKIGLLINASRSIIYASHEKDFAEKAKEEATKIQKAMEKIMLRLL